MPAWIPASAGMTPWARNRAFVTKDDNVDSPRVIYYENGAIGTSPGRRSRRGGWAL